MGRFPLVAGVLLATSAPFDGARESEIRERYERAANGASIVARAIFVWCRGHRDEH